MAISRGRWLLAASWLLAPVVLQDPTPAPLGPGPAWRGPVRPVGQNEVFATADGCAMCHSAATRSTAMRSAIGDDVSPHGLWQASVMANSFRDPYWRATVAKEVALDPERADEVQALCLRCHAPMVHHSRRIAGQEPTTVAAAAAEPLAQDGVSCTVCHQIRAEGLGTPTTFDGKGKIGRERQIFGPYADPAGAPMRMHSGYTPTHGAHVRDSALCATCHTLHTSHQGERFPEQTPYLEWRNSEFTTEPAATATSRSCQQCHMAELAPTRIARNPAGRDFLIPVRPDYRGHTFVGGNAFLLDLLARHRDELGVPASASALAQNAMASRKLLAEQTVALSIGEVVRQDGELRFAVRVENLTGHKFPTGYPARRAWLQLQVRAGDRVVFESGGYTTAGDLVDVAEPLQQGHVTAITSPGDVLVYELIALDGEGAPTTHLSQMARRGKDNRLLPRGWRRDGPDAEDTAPVGIGTDIDFTAGGDSVDVTIPFAAGSPRATVVAWVRYQAIPPHWVAALRAVDAPECRQFVTMYDAADKTPETVAVTQRLETR
jgi:hypothetical protein